MSDAIFDKIETVVHNKETFENGIITHIQTNHFPLIYQCLYRRIMPDGKLQFTTEQFKKLLNQNYLELLNDIYSTRLSNKGINNVSKELNKVKDFDNYDEVLKLFKDCNPRKIKNGQKPVNAFSFGTKVLHTYNPEENPILDSVIRKTLKIKNMDICSCADFKEAMTRFAKKHDDYFRSFENNDIVKAEFEKYNLKANFPKMKILDMALLGNAVNENKKGR